MSESFVAILMGSDSDLPIMKETLIILHKLEIRAEIKITSAHRTPERTRNYIKDAENRGCKVFICAAGLAAHLAGTVAAHTTKPVIGVPLDGGQLSGLDALLSTVQMPRGVPVATVAIGKTGAMNAAMLAAQILALSDNLLARKLVELRKKQEAEVIEKEQKAFQALDIF